MHTLLRLLAAALVATSPLQGQQCPDGPVALVLAGGGAKGFAHIGVLRALDSLGVSREFPIPVMFRD